MPKCRDCLHWEVCTEYQRAFWGHRAQYHSPIVNASTDSCTFYKDRSRFVELPCKVGTTVYTVSLKHGVVPWGVYAMCSTVNEWDAAPKITLLARSKKIDKSAKFSASAVSTSVFFTREEAEQTLKEREENDKQKRSDR